VTKSDLLTELTDVMSDGVAQDLWVLSFGIICYHPMKTELFIYDFTYVERICMKACMKTTVIWEMGF
jgi:hypothetical protein